MGQTSQALHCAAVRPKWVECVASLLGEMGSVVDLFNLMGMQEALALDAKWTENPAVPRR